MDSDSELQQSKRRRSHQREDQSVTGLENLPHEIITEVTSRLPFSSLVKFRYVCRAWKNLAQDQHLRIFDALHNSNTANHNNLCLIFHCDYPIRNHIYFVDYPFHHGEKETMLVKKIHPPFCGSMPEFDVVGSCDGLLCLSDSLYNDAICIYNPFTRDHRELPKSVRFPNQEVIYGFGFHPITKEYKVVKIVYYSRRESWSRFRVYRPQSEVQVFTLGTSDWRSLGGTSHYLHHWPAQVLVNGRLHWVTWRKGYHPGRKLISFDLGDEQFREVPKPEGDGLSRWNYHVLVVRGCLAAFFNCSYGKLEMWVMEEYGVKESWVKELTIGSYVPKTLKQDVDRSWKISKIVKRGRHVRVLCVLGSGQILLEYKSRALVVYEPSSGKFKDLLFQGMPKWFQTVVHEGTLNPIHTLVNM